MMNLAEDDDWVHLPDAATYRLLLLLHDDTLASSTAVPLRSSPSVFNMDHFSTSDSHLPPKIIVPHHFPPSPTFVVHRFLHQQQIDEQEDIKIGNTPDADASAAVNNKVFFKSGNVSKKNIESVDMKFLDSSSSPTATSPRKMKSVFEIDDLFSENKSPKLINSDRTTKISDDMKWIGEGIVGDDYVTNDDGGGGGGGGGIIGGLNLWKLGFVGFGAICSIGVAAAATLCVILFGNRRKAKQNHKLSFHIYSDEDQRMERVAQQATMFNEAMSTAVRGVPLMNRAHITYGGYYENAL